MPRTTDPTSPATEVVTFRLSAELYRRLVKEARSRRMSKTDILRSVLSAHLQAPAEDRAAEARRQSMLAAAVDRDGGLAAFMDAAHDDRGWR